MEYAIPIPLSSHSDANSPQTQTLSTTWAWRIPSLLQAFPSLACFVVLLFVPESPRWLISRGRKEEALEIIALASANGNMDDPVVQLQFKEIEDTISFERHRESSSYKALLHPSNRKRLLITLTFPLIVMLPGTVSSLYTIRQIVTNLS